MRHCALLLVLAALVAAPAGCGLFRAPVIPPQGMLFSRVTAPLSTDFDETPVCVKWGEASSQFFHEPLFTQLDFAWDKALLGEAARNGGLSKIHYADYEHFRVLGIYSKFTVRAYGE